MKDLNLFPYVTGAKNPTIKTDRERPFYSKPCKEEFVLKEENIFISKDIINKTINYRFHTLCPNCGYIVNVNDELLSNKIKDRIIKRCENDNYLYRKMYLTSELKSLEIKSQQDLVLKREKGL